MAPESDECQMTVPAIVGEIGEGSGAADARYHAHRRRIWARSTTSDRAYGRQGEPMAPSGVKQAGKGRRDEPIPPAGLVG
jgi:hypothetical protein